MQSSPEFDREWTRAVLQTFFPKAFEAMKAAPKNGEASRGSNEKLNAPSGE